MHTLGQVGADISPDGQRFLMINYQKGELKPADKLVLIQNWFDELERIAPVKK